jgi:hypothetical protein
LRGRASCEEIVSSCQADMAQPKLEEIDHIPEPSPSTRHNS